MASRATFTVASATRNSICNDFFLASSIKQKVAPASRPGIRLWLRLRLRLRCAWCPAAACGKVALGQVCKWLQQPQPQPDLFGFQIDELSMKPLPPPSSDCPFTPPRPTFNEPSAKRGICFLISFLLVKCWLQQQQQQKQV